MIVVALEMLSLIIPPLTSDEAKCIVPEILLKEGKEARNRKEEEEKQKSRVEKRKDQRIEDPEEKKVLIVPSYLRLDFHCFGSTESSLLVKENRSES